MSYVDENSRQYVILIKNSGLDNGPIRNINFNAREVFDNFFANYSRLFIDGKRIFYTF